MIQVKEAVLSDYQLLQMYSAVLINASPKEYDLNSNEDIARAINCYYGEDFDGTVTAEQISKADIEIQQQSYGY